MKILLWLSVVPAGTSAPAGASGNLYYRWLETGALPSLDDEIVLTLPEDPKDGMGGGPMWSLHRRYLWFDGTWSFELSKMHLDPDEDMQRLLHGPSNDRWARPWWTDRDGDPQPALLLSGWRRYEGTIEP